MVSCTFSEGDSWATSEDQFNWQTQALDVSILRDDTAKRKWKRIFAQQDTEAEAEDILKTVLGVVEA